MAEYAVSADYKSRRKGHPITIQIAAIGPAGATKAQAKDAVEETINNDGSAPNGWTIKIIDWRSGEEWDGQKPIRPRREHAQDAWSTLSGPLALADLDALPIRPMGRKTT